MVEAEGEAEGIIAIDVAKAAVDGLFDFASALAEKGAPVGKVTLSIVKQSVPFAVFQVAVSDNALATMSGSLAGTLAAGAITGVMLAGAGAAAVPIGLTAVAVTTGGTCQRE